MQSPPTEAVAVSEELDRILASRVTDASRRVVTYSTVHFFCPSFLLRSVHLFVKTGRCRDHLRGRNEAPSPGSEPQNHVIGIAVSPPSKFADECCVFRPLSCLVFLAKWAAKIARY